MCGIYGWILWYFNPSTDFNLIPVYLKRPEQLIQPNGTIEVDFEVDCITLDTEFRQQRPVEISD